MKYFFPLTILTLLLVVVLSHHFASYLPGQIDFTDDQRYTLSPGTDEILDQMKMDLEVLVFRGSNLPIQFKKVDQELTDTLKTYAEKGSKHLKIRHFDPLTDPESERLAASLQIPPIQLQVFAQDERQVLKTYFGLAVVRPNPNATDADNPYEAVEVLPVLSDLTDFEYQFSSAILKLSRLLPPKLGVIRGHGEYEITSIREQTPDPMVRAFPIRETIERFYDVESIDLAVVEDLEDYTTLLLPDPQGPLTDDETNLLQEYVQSGGNVIVLRDRVQVDNRFVAIDQGEVLQSLLAPWGVELLPVLIQDQSHVNAKFSQGFFSFQIPYALWVKPFSYPSQSNITRQLERIVFPWAGEIKLTKTPGIIHSVLAESSSFYNALTPYTVRTPEATEEDPNPKPVREPKPININPEELPAINRQPKDPVPYMVQLEFPQYPESGKAIVVSDSSWLQAQFLGQYPDNALLLMNMLDSLSFGDTLISIRSKAITDRPIRELPAAQIQLFKILLPFGVPLLIVLLGLMRKWRRDKRQ